MPTLRLLSKTNLVDNIWSFVWEPHPSFSWTAGQFIRVELPHDHPDKEGTKRWFTVSAAPYEGHPQITTRITTSTFKQTLVNIPVGGEITLLANPDGDFIWEDSELPMVFIAAGIGVTPFRSILAQRAHADKPLNVTLVYANRTEAAAFIAEFKHYQEQFSDFKLQLVTGGLLTAGRLYELMPDLNQSMVYLSGPEPMVEALGDELRSTGLPEQQLKQDFFPNYTESNY
jgi:ferredoxin-NADP reductase